MKRIIGIILSVIGIAALATGIIMYQGESDKKEKIKEEEKEEKKEDKPTEEVKLAVGPYKKGEDVMYIYNNGEYVVSFDIIETPLIKNGNQYEANFFNTTVIVKPVENDVEVTITSDEPEEEALSGTYVKQEFTDLGWSGTYTSGNTEIILSQYDSDKMNVDIVYSDDETGNSKSFAIVEGTMTAEKVEYINESFGEKFIATKTENGITIESSYEDEEDLLNSINGLTFVKEGAARSLEPIEELPEEETNVEPTEEITNEEPETNTEVEPEVEPEAEVIE